MSAFATQFKKQARVMTRDLRHRQLIRTTLRNYEIARDKRKAAFQDWQAARQAAAETKWEAVNHLDQHLVELATRLESHGTKVHWASTGAQACDIIVGIVRDRKARSIIKSKAMTAEEIHLNEALEHAGFDVVESDHIKTGVFQRELGDAPSDNPEELTMVARRVMRQKY